jgi:hypothetical protein
LHQDNDLASPTAQPEQVAKDQVHVQPVGIQVPKQAESHIAQENHDAQPMPRAEVPLPVTPTIGQWPGAHPASYLAGEQNMLHARGDNTGLETHPVVAHDADILQAAQLLLPGAYRDNQPVGRQPGVILTNHWIANYS